MIQYEWEQGTIKFSSKAYTRFRRKVLMRWNNIQEDMFREAVRLHKELRVLDSHWARRQVFARNMGVGYRPMSAVREFERVLDLNNGKCRRPERGDFPKVKASEGCDIVVAGGLARVFFDDEVRELYWRVFESINARGQAHTDPFVIYLFETLAEVKWTEGNGGEIRKHDSMARDRGFAELTSFKFGLESCPDSA